MQTIEIRGLSKCRISPKKCLTVKDDFFSYFGNPTAVTSWTFFPLDNFSIIWGWKSEVSYDLSLIKLTNFIYLSIYSSIVLVDSFKEEIGDSGTSSFSALLKYSPSDSEAAIDLK